MGFFTFIDQSYCVRLDSWGGTGRGCQVRRRKRCPPRPSMVPRVWHQHQCEPHHHQRWGGLHHAGLFRHIAGLWRKPGGVHGASAGIAPIPCPFLSTSTCVQSFYQARHIRGVGLLFCLLMTLFSACGVIEAHYLYLVTYERVAAVVPCRIGSSCGRLAPLCRWRSNQRV